MTFKEFKSSLNHSHPPATANDLLLALWYDAKGDWHTAHRIAQDVLTPDGSWVHAYLHRKEGDQWNAGYWYRRANRPVPACGLKEEWEELVQYFLKN